MYIYFDIAWHTSDSAATATQSVSSSSVATHKIDIKSQDPLPPVAADGLEALD